MNPLWNLVVAAEAKHGDAPALHTETRTYSFHEVRRIAENIAGELRAHGLRPGDVLATVLPNAFDWLVTLAAAHEGLLSVSLHHAGQAADLDSRLIVGTPERLTVPTSVPILQIDEHWVRRHESGTDATPARDFDSVNSLVRLVLTSGTTGKAKAAEYTVGTLQARIDSSEAAWGQGGNSRLNLMGFSSMGGLYSGMLHLWSGTPFVALNAITSRVPHLIDEFGITLVVGATVSLAQLLDAMQSTDASCATIARVLIAGSTPSDELLRRIELQLPSTEISILYGSTEAGLIAGKPARLGDDPRNVGYPMPGVSIEIVDDNDELVQAGTVGIVRYRSPELILMYFRDPELTAAAIRDGWFYPGDRARISDAGELIIAGRIDDVINIGGVKVDPLSLESTALTVPGVVDAAAYPAVAENGSPMIAMDVVVKDDPGAIHDVDTALRAAHPLTVPGRYRVVDSLPRNQMGKLVRHEIGADR